MQPTTSPQTNEADWTLSIDFGTSSTVAAMTFGDGRTEVLEVDGERRTPSVVLVDDDGSLVVGAAAVGLAASRPERTIRAPKRRLGEQTPVVLGGRPYNPVDLVAAVLRFVHAAAERHVGSPPSAVRLTHPATWSRPLQQRLLEAAAKAGMPDVDLVAEPVAAAMSAADRSLPVGSYIAVYDLGGGTFDTTVVQSAAQGYQVVGHPIGDRQIGGELFDEALMNHVGSRLDPAIWEKLQVSDEREWHQAASRLLGECRRVKEALSTHGYGEIVVGTPGGMIEERITRDELESLAAPYLDASVDLLERCVDDVGIEPSQLAAIHMIGGASRMPLAAAMVEEAFPGVDVSQRGDPRTAVATGAALVDLSAQPPHLVADRNTTVERRQRSIDADAEAIDAAAAARVTPPETPGGANITPPTHPSVIGSTPPDPPTVVGAGSGTVQPTEPATPTVAPQYAAPAQPTGVANTSQTPAQPFPAQPLGAATPPPGITAASAQRDEPSNVPLLASIAALSLILVGMATYLLITRGDDADTIDVATDDTQATTTPTADGPLPSLNPVVDETTPTTEPTTTPPETTAPPTTAPATTAPPTTVQTGPTRDDAVGILFDVSEVPGGGWIDGTYDPDPIFPCGLIDPHQPVFTEGRTFEKNLGQVDAASVTHTVHVYANETEAARVIEAQQTLSDNCPTDTLSIDGLDLDASFITCDPVATCPDPFPESTVAFLPGEQFVLQFALITQTSTGLVVTDQIYGMRIGRSIVVVEYVVPGEPTETQFNEASSIAITAWGRAADLPR